MTMLCDERISCKRTDKQARSNAAERDSQPLLRLHTERFVMRYRDQFRVKWMRYTRIYHHIFIHQEFFAPIFFCLFVLKIFTRELSHSPNSDRHLAHSLIFIVMSDISDAGDDSDGDEFLCTFSLIISLAFFRACNVSHSLLIVVALMGWIPNHNITGACK